MKAVFPQKRPSRVKIVATLGPASNSEEIIRALILEGVDVFRLNMAHNGTEKNEPVLHRVRKISREIGIPVAVLADLAGPKMRLGELSGGMKICQAGEMLRLVRPPKKISTTILNDDKQLSDKLFPFSSSSEEQKQQTQDLGLTNSNNLSLGEVKVDYTDLSNSETALFNDAQIDDSSLKSATSKKTLISNSDSSASVNKGQELFEKNEFQGKKASERLEKSNGITATSEESKKTETVFVPAENELTTTYPPLIDDLKIGDRILLADGTVVLQVVSKEPDAVECQVLQGGTIRSRQGVNLPNVELSVKTLQPDDIKNAVWAAKVGLDFLGLSFVRTPNDVLELRQILRQTLLEQAENEGKLLSEEELLIQMPQIIAKIEKPETLKHLNEIVDISDGVMVARGDLGVETDIAKIAVVQKEIIDICRRKAKPVIVATQMLESMTEESFPTRAEATDVANAILDGTDACMLSGETAIGKHPLLVVQMMHRIASETEKLIQKRIEDKKRFGFSKECSWKMVRSEEQKDEKEGLAKSVRTSVCVCEAAGNLAEAINASMILVSTCSGQTALNLSNRRNFAMTVGTSTSERTLRRLCLYWGVLPIGGISQEPRQMLYEIIELGKKAGYLQSGDQIVLTTSVNASAATDVSKSAADISPSVAVSQGERNAIYVHTV